MNVVRREMRLRYIWSLSALAVLLVGSLLIFRNYLLGEGVADDNVALVWLATRILRADPNARFYEGDRPLHLLRKDSRVVATLLSSGAEINATNDQGQTALIVAIYTGNVTGVQVLLAAGANTDMADSSGMTSMKYALKGNNLEIITFLRKYGAR